MEKEKENILVRLLRKDYKGQGLSYVSLETLLVMVEELQALECMNSVDGKDKMLVMHRKEVLQMEIWL